MSAWDEGRPIFKRLPQYGWQDNSVADALTAAYDAVLMELQQRLLGLPDEYLNPDTCRADVLDWLAQLSGYTGPYWDASWPVAVKRQLIKDAQSIVWNYRGTGYLLNYLIDLFGLTNARLQLLGAWLVGVTEISAPIGGETLTYSIVIGSDAGIGYLRGDAQWRLLERLARLYMPCWCAPATLNRNFLHYHRFRIGLSAVGDPI